DGSINAAVVNNGTIASPANLTITGGVTNHGVMSGSGRINAGINNAADGQLRLSTGQRLLLSSGAGNIANSGRFDVLGGELEVDGPLNNAGQIGLIGATLRADSGLVNLAGGSITARDSALFIDGGLANTGTLGVSFGTSDIFGFLSNNNGGKIILSGNSQTTFYAPLTNNTGAELRVSAGSTAVFFGAVNS